MIKKYILFFALIIGCAKENTGRLNSSSIDEGQSHPTAIIDSLCYNSKGKVYHVKVTFHRCIAADSQVVAYETNDSLISYVVYHGAVITTSKLHTYKSSSTGEIVVSIWRKKNLLFADSTNVYGQSCN
jgi:hypothetical protein